MLRQSKQAHPLGRILWTAALKRLQPADLHVIAKGAQLPKVHGYQHGMRNTPSPPDEAKRLTGSSGMLPLWKIKRISGGGGAVAQRARM